jgi:hypothetical protein
MVIERSTLLEAPPERVIAELRRTALLRHVSWPLLSFEPEDPPAFPERWEAGTYRVRLRAFGVVPLGWQEVRTEELPGEPGRWLLRDDGRGSLVRRWDHLITVEPGGPGRTRYTDRVEVEAGLLTPAVGAFAHVFYAHRQRRLRRLVASGFDFGGEGRSPS